MTDITESIKPYLSADETIRAARADNSSAVVVTDRRVMEVKRGAGSRGRNLKQAKSTLITGPNILGVEIVEAGSEPVDTAGLISGVVAFVIGLGIFFLMGTVSGEAAEIADLFGLGAALLGGLFGMIFIWGAIQTKSGGVTVNFFGDEGDVVESISLAEEEADVAAEISTVVGETE
ncbi:hypothetical protein G3I44_12435 [Halogeometricum borinquense]|uniref:Uncharacterized protein n=1 Tax=Halogeometricum borinquense TaxID=60847 RepID=A0A6C0UHW2_9EURY|nr:hypothetical protein [Halogeometricum borinquense]QIB75015.1 hypothetical protein G3I44_12435 [Halogeometricum borinquense]